MPKFRVNYIHECRTAGSIVITASHKEEADTIFYEKLAKGELNDLKEDVIHDYIDRESTEEESE